MEFMTPHELHVIWIIDSSSGMVGSKLQALNAAIRESIPAFREIADDHFPGHKMMMSAITYGTGARWHLGPTPIEIVSWPELFDYGRSDAGAAFQLVELFLWRLRYLNVKWFSPEIIWVASSEPTDHCKDQMDALIALSRTFGATRLAISIGKDAPQDCLQHFIDNPEIKPLTADRAWLLTRYIRIGDDEIPVSEKMEEVEEPKDKLLQAELVPKNWTGGVGAF